MLLPLEVLYNSAKWANPYWRAKHGNKTVKNIQDLHEQKGLRLSKYQLSLITKKRNAALLRNKRYVAGNKIYKVISHYRQRKRINHIHGQVARVIQIRNQRIQNRKMHSVTNNNIAKIATILQRRFRLRQKQNAVKIGKWISALLSNETQKLLAIQVIVIYQGVHQLKDMYQYRDTIPGIVFSKIHTKKSNKTMQFSGQNRKSSTGLIPC
jgi:uncharacterized protein YeaC (DUF1315 family)